MQVIIYRELFSKLTDKGKQIDRNGDYWFIKKKIKSSVVNEYISHKILLLMKYSTPCTLILKDKDNYYNASRYIEKSSRVLIGWTISSKKYYIIKSLIPCLFGGSEPCEVVYSNTRKPYIIDCELNFYHQPKYSHIAQAERVAKIIKANEEIINVFIKTFVVKYEKIKEMIEQEKQYGYISELNRISKILKASFEISNFYLEEKRRTIAST